MTSRTATWFLSLFLFGSVAAAQYVPPRELIRNGFGSINFLNHFPTYSVAYQWMPQSKEVRFVIQWRPASTDKWKEPFEQIETVAYYMTAVAPLYAGDWDSLYVIGVNVDGKTIIEKWKVVLTAIPDGPPKVVVKKTQILASAALTTIRAAAAAPNDQFLIVQRHEDAPLVQHVARARAPLRREPRPLRAASVGSRKARPDSREALSPSCREVSAETSR
ncbi:MAG: hypothetical protein HYR85_19445 [Planctomycetes bacterium]|nr:hypothetical protein [Planctomycetota bacterium]MBI3846770.1 hypothetical protein [Planctomycetota bacterium]